MDYNEEYAFVPRAVVCRRAEGIYDAEVMFNNENRTVGKGYNTHELAKTEAQKMVDTIVKAMRVEGQRIFEMFPKAKP